MDNQDHFKISLPKLAEGISYCFRKSYAFTDNARTLFDQHKDSDIVSALLVSAIEELGNGLILQEFHIKQITAIPKWIFGGRNITHVTKIQKGMDALGEQSLLHPKLFQILNHKETIFNSDGSITFPLSIIISQKDFSEMTNTGFGQNLDSMVDYKSKLDQNKKFQLFYVDWNPDKKLWQYGMWHNDYQIDNLICKLEIFLKKYHNTDADYNFVYD